MDARFEPVLPSHEVGGEIRRVTIGAVDMLVCRLACGDVVAFGGTCPHQRTDLGGATLVDGCVQCPLHSYMYDARTGENIVPSRDLDPRELWKAAPGYLPVYPVEEHEGWVWVGPEPRPPPAAYDPESERPPAVGPAPAPVARSVEVVRVGEGATFEVRVATSPRPGFVWRVEIASLLLAAVGQRSEADNYVVRLTARAAGRCLVTCLYTRPWDREPADVRTFVVLVEPG